MSSPLPTSERPPSPPRAQSSLLSLSRAVPPQMHLSDSEYMRADALALSHPHSDGRAGMLVPGGARAS